MAQAISVDDAEPVLADRPDGRQPGRLFYLFYQVDTTRAPLLSIAISRCFRMASLPQADNANIANPRKKESAKIRWLTVIPA